MLRKSKHLIRKSLNCLGYDIVRYPVDKLESPRTRFEPSEVNKFAWLSSLSINTVIDIGAHAGEFARKIHGILPAATIYSVEPLYDVFRELQNNLKDIPNFKAFNCALGDKALQTTIFRNEFTPSSSLLPMAQIHKNAFPFTVKADPQPVEVQCLDYIICDSDLRDNILVKLDVQGYEDKVIKGGERTISRATLVIAEISFRILYEQQPLFGEIYQLMKERGFRYVGSWEQLASPLDGRILQADAIFERNDA
jgi:FkbM family methyltransferase